MKQKPPPMWAETSIVCMNDSEEERHYKGGNHWQHLHWIEQLIFLWVLKLDTFGCWIFSFFSWTQGSWDLLSNRFWESDYSNKLEISSFLHLLASLNCRGFRQHCILKWTTSHVLACIDTRVAYTSHVWLLFLWGSQASRLQSEF